MIEEDGAEACFVGSRDIGGEIIAYHDGFLGLGACQLEGILEEEGAGFVGSGILGEDDMLEVGEAMAGTQLAVLNLVEAVAADAEDVAATLQIVEQLVCSLDDSGFYGAARKEIVADLKAELDGGVEALALGKGATEALYYQVIARYLSLGILVPQLYVGLPIGHGKGFLGGEVPVELEMLEQLGK